MRKQAAALALVGTLVGTEVLPAQEHVVTPEAAQVRLAEAAMGRQRSLAAVEQALSSPEAAVAASALRVDLSQLRTSTSALSDEELSDLAARVAALGTDPVAGAMDRDIKLLLMILLIVAIVALVL